MKQQPSERCLVGWALFLVAVALLATVFPFWARNLGPRSTVPLSLLDVQRWTVGALIPLALAPAAGVWLYRAGIDGETRRRNLTLLATGLLAVSMTIYRRWWYEPIAFVHGLPLPALLNILLWSITGVVAYGLAAALTQLCGQVRGRGMAVIYGTYAAALAVVVALVLGPVASVERLPASRTLCGDYDVALLAEFAQPYYQLSDWVLESWDAGGRGLLYLVAGDSAVGLDLETGREIWRTVLGLTPARDALLHRQLALHVDERGLYVVHHSEEGRVVSLDKRSGSLQWQAEFAADPGYTGGAGAAQVRFTPERIIILPGYADRAPIDYYLVDRQTGSLTHVQDVLPEGHLAAAQYAGSAVAWAPGAAGQLALHIWAYPPGFGSEMIDRQDWSWASAGWLVGISPETGLPEWRAAGIGARDPNPGAGVAVDEAGWLAHREARPGNGGGAGDLEFVYHSLPDGELSWRLPSEQDFASVWLVGPGALLAEFNGGQVALRYVERALGEVLWRRELAYRQMLLRPVVVTGEHIAFNWDQRVLVLRVADGATAWERAIAESRGPADRVEIESVYSAAIRADDDDVLLVLREQIGAAGPGRTVAVHLETGTEIPELPEYHDLVAWRSDGYLLWRARADAGLGGDLGSPAGRWSPVPAGAWHRVLRSLPATGGGGGQLIKLPGEVVRANAAYAGTEVTGATPWGPEGYLVFPFHGGEAWGSLGVSPDTGAFEVGANAVVRRFGGQLLALVRDGASQRCWIVGLRLRE